MKATKFRKAALFMPAVLSLFAAISQDTIVVTSNLITKGIPPIPASIVNEVKPYINSRFAFMVDWSPVNLTMLISTRFANTYQLHLVNKPGGERKQLTFFDEGIRNANFNPVTGKYFLYTKDVGGNEFRQIYKYDMSTGKSNLLTDGRRSQNSDIIWDRQGDRIVYCSTSRNGTDRDIYMMNPLDSSSNKLLITNTGGGWGIDDWSTDGKKLLIEEQISVNDVRIWEYDFTGNRKTKLSPDAHEKTVYQNAFFSIDGKGIYLITDQNSQFLKLAWYDLTTHKTTILTPEIHWDISQAVMTKDGKQIAFTVNEAGSSKLYIMNTGSRQYSPVNVATGIITNLNWNADSQSLAFSFTSSTISEDVFVWNTSRHQLTRWTESELGGIDVSSLSPAQLIKWKSFDGKEISGFLYSASSKFKGSRPVIIDIHGGPEGQSQPSFAGPLSYYMNELGISVIKPNVRGSIGFGKSFTDLDNGIKREDAVKDIGALLDWIGAKPGLDSSRIMITGGSYGGYMTLACATHFNDRIRCAVDIVGPSNFNTFLKHTESYRRDLRRVEYGDERDTAMASFFERTAPLNNTGKITKPLFIVAGRNDPRVPYTESQQMADKISAQGSTIWFLMANDEGHGFSKRTNRDFQFYASVEFIKRFLLGN